MKIEEIEKRFKEVTGLADLDLTKFPIRKNDYENQQQKTSNEDQKKHGYVTTPIFLVDIMISMKYKDLRPDLLTLDLCCGEAGQFTIRLMRCLYNKFHIDVDEWLKNYHFMNEYSEKSCEKIKYIYGDQINLCIGDARNLKYLNEDQRGILKFDEKNNKWYEI